MHINRPPNIQRGARGGGLGGKGGGGGSAVGDRTFYNSTLDGKSGNSTLEAAVLARIAVQYDRLVLINTFQEGTVPTFGVEG